MSIKHLSILLRKEKKLIKIQNFDSLQREFPFSYHWEKANKNDRLLNVLAFLEHSNPN
jgi:hypothetical protein